MSPHHFLSLTKEGRSAIFSTRGNEDAHIILRGGKDRPNYDEVSVDQVAEGLEAGGLRPNIMIDFSHANCQKKFERQMHVAQDVASQIANGDVRIIGAMVESHLVEGRQNVEGDKPLVYGQSITDPCLGWDDSIKLLNELAVAVQQRRAAIRRNV